MQLKEKDMQLKVSMQKNIGERGLRRDICSLSSSFSRGEKQSLILELEKLLSCKESLILVSKGKKLLTCL